MAHVAMLVNPDSVHDDHCIFYITLEYIYLWGNFISKMITLPESYPKHTLSPEIDDEKKL